MNLYQTKLFTTLQKQYKNRFGVDISQFVKLTNYSINFDQFEKKHLTIKQKNVIKSIQKNNEKKIILSGGIASGKTYLACYLFIKSLIANKKLYSSDTNNFIIGNSQRSVEVNVLGQFEKLCKLLDISYMPRHTNNSYIMIDSLRINLYVTQINITQDYVFTSPIAYLDPAFSIGGDNTALCVMERVDDKYYAFVFQDQRPANDPYIMNMVKTVLANFNVHTFYLEDRDNTKGAGALTREYMALRNNMSQHFRIVPVKSKSNKFSRITSLITPFTYKKLYIAKYSSSSVFNDIYAYKGDNKIHDDALDAISAAYLMLSLGYRERSVHFSNQKFL
ncbi:terminase large subunit domain-containing protein [Borreliella bavariensis]|uniref:phage terminase large subunit family protein n=1 Tax=Borreliella bavariensis TaxID=664662 RepID=UPI00165E75E9